jgi:pyruvate dehydrogenase E1 component alpha subunit
MTGTNDHTVARSLKEPVGAEPLSVLAPDGTLRRGASAPMDEQAVLDALRLMMLSRALDDRATKLNRLGKLGVYGPVQGQEASVVGSHLAIDPARDWLVPAYREQPAMLRQGYPLANLLAAYMGRPSAARVPDGVRMLPRQQAVGAQLPQAVGLAWGLKLQRSEAVVLTYAGEGATSEGDFHEACNLAGVTRAPIVFVIQNNGWAISTPSELQTAAASIASRAQGYGLAGAPVDGNDLFAVYATAKASVERARGGGGGTLIETRTFRLGFHNTTDNPRRYRDPKLERDARELDPVRRVQRYLTAVGAFDDSIRLQWEAEVAAEVEVAVRDADSFPRPGLEDVFEHAYATLPRRAEAQREAMRKQLGG